MQLSVVVGSQATHAAPEAPHAVVLGVVHVEPAQQPVVHVVEHPEQEPPTQLWPLGHAVHAPPMVPQVVALAVWHVPLASQQPVGHEAALQTHAPPTQALPAPHAAPVPQWQLPPEQESLVAASHAVHAAPPVPHAVVSGVLQTSPAQQPLAQEVAVHLQAPPTQARPGAQAAPPAQEQVPAEVHV